MSDTPETDAKASPHIGFFSCATVPAEFARRLERERDEAKNRMADALQELDLRTLDFERMRAERDEARDMVEKFTEQGLDLLDSNRTLKRERDTALDKISELKGVIRALRSNLRETSREAK